MPSPAKSVPSPSLISFPREVTIRRLLREAQANLNAAGNLAERAGRASASVEESELRACERCGEELAADVVRCLSKTSGLARSRGAVLEANAAVLAAVRTTIEAADAFTRPELEDEDDLASLASVVRDACRVCSLEAGPTAIVSLRRVAREARSFTATPARAPSLELRRVLGRRDARAAARRALAACHACALALHVLQAE